MTAYVDRCYDEMPPWLGRPRRKGDHREPGEWSVGTGEDVDTWWFEDADEAIAYARTLASIVLVRLGGTEDTIYSAGETRANRYVDGSGLDYPEWPPDDWPEYRGSEFEPRALTIDACSDDDRRRG
jgi:hypothetical protein